MQNNKFEEAKNIIRKLNKHGHLAYIVGGWVRDYILHKQDIENSLSLTSDIDICTSAEPQEILKIFENNNRDSLLVGKVFGVVIVKSGEHFFDVSTFRKDRGTLDGRHPEAVSFSKDPYDDVQRRDFTINALLYEIDDGVVIDYVGGEEDLANKTLKFVGCPAFVDRRIKEDYLRMLRAVRFTAKYDLNIEHYTACAIKNNSKLINCISKERIFEELEKILMLPHHEKGIEILQNLGLLKEILPDIENMRGMPQPKKYHPEGDVFEHTCLTLKSLGPNCSRELAWAALLHDAGKTKTLDVSAYGEPTFHGHDNVGAEMAESILRDLKADNHLINTVKEMVLNHMKFRFVKEMKKSTLARFIYRENFMEELSLHVADCMASHGKLDNYHYILEVRNNLSKPIIKNEIPKVITGFDLLNLGFAPGPVFKEILEQTHDYLIEQELPLTKESKEEALEFVKNKYIRKY